MSEATAFVSETAKLVKALSAFWWPFLVGLIFFNLRSHLIALLQKVTTDLPALLQAWRGKEVDSAIIPTSDLNKNQLSATTTKGDQS